MNSTLFRIAVRNVARNKRRSLVTLFAVIFGVTVVILLAGFADGFVKMTIENVVNTKIGALQIHKKGYLKNTASNPTSFHFPYSSELLDRVKGVPGVTAVTGRIAFSGIASNGRSQAVFFGTAIDLNTEKTVCPKYTSVLEQGGTPLSPEDNAHALVGAELARSFNVVPTAATAGLSATPPTGSEESVDSLNLSSASPDGRQNSLDVRVKGLSRSNLPIEEKRVITVPLSVAQELLGLSGRVTELAVAVDDLAHTDKIVTQLAQTLGPEYEVHNWQEIQPFLRDVIFRQKIMIGLVSVVLFVLVLFLIANTMLMSVFERVREIGTMLSIGIRKEQVLQIFVCEALALGLVGALLGALLGTLAVTLLGIRGIEFSSASGVDNSVLYTTITAGFVGSAVALASLCSGLAGLYPAWKASRLDPVEALRST